MLGSESKQRQEAADDFKAALNVFIKKKKMSSVRANLIPPLWIKAHFLRLYNS